MNNNEIVDTYLSVTRMDHTPTLLAIRIAPHKRNLSSFVKEHY